MEDSYNEKNCKTVVVFKRLLCVTLLIALTMTGCSSGQKAPDNSSISPTSSVGAESTGSPTSSPGESAGSEGTVGFEGDPNLNAPGVFPICKETVTLKIAVPQTAVVEDWETCYQTKYIEEKCNFDLQFEVFPAGDEYAQQLMLMVAAGGDELPDVIINGLTDTRVYQFAQAGAIVNLSEYLDNSSYFVNEAKERTGVDFMQMITSPDGNVYAMPQYNQSLGNEYPGKMWIYKPWLDKLKLNIPTNTDELYNVLKAFKTQDPNGNNKQDEIPLVDQRDTWHLRGAVKALIVPFQNVQVSEWYTVENGKVYMSYTTDGFKESMRYIRKLVEEDLLSPLTFTQDPQQLNAMVGGGETIVGMVVGYSPVGGLEATDPRRAEYVSVPPFTSNDGKNTQYALYAPTVAIPAGAVTKTCKTPEAAFRFLDYMVSEEISIMTRFGEKGVDWLEPEPGEKSMYDVLGYPAVIKAVSPWGQVQNKWWSGVGPLVRQYSIAAGMVWNGDALNSEYIIAQAQGGYTGHAPNEVIPKLVFTDEEEKTISEIVTTTNEYVKETIASFAVGNLDVDKDWNNFQNDLKTMGLDKMVEVYQVVYDRMYK